jgi:hypothetical protein
MVLLFNNAAPGCCGGFRFVVLLYQIGHISCELTICYGDVPICDTKQSVVETFQSLCSLLWIFRY